MLAFLAISGGFFHAPNNYDALAYRVPRILNWIAEGQWHWIPTIFQRLNTRACGIEWVSSPLLLLTGSDRLLFLPNAVSFLLMPGLVFGVLFRLGVRKRLAWQWMWILPTGYCYLLQAGSIGNDLYGTVLALCAVDLALRSRESVRVEWTLLSILAAGVMTAGKTNNMTLGLAWIVILSPRLWDAVRKHTVKTLAVMIVAASASFLPTALLNQWYSGEWSGSRVEGLDAYTKGAPLARLGNNLALTALQNAVPPVFPFASQWNDLIDATLPHAYRERMEVLFEPGGAHWRLPELQIEEDASVGFGIMLLLLVGIAASFGKGPAGVPRHDPMRLGLSVAACTAAGFLAYCSHSGLSAVGRYFGFYFPYLLAPLLWLSGFSRVARSRFWKTCCVLVFGMGGLLLFLSPARPLFPLETTLSAVGSRGASSPLMQRVAGVYSTYAGRNEAFFPLVEKFQGEKTIGIFTFDDPETSLWKPFGSRRVVHITPGDDGNGIRARGVRVGAFDAKKLEKYTGMSPDSWCRRVGAIPINKVTLELRAGSGPVEWTVIAFP